MQYRALRKTASSELLLSAAIVMLFATLLSLADLWYQVAANTAFQERIHTLENASTRVEDCLWTGRTLVRMLPICAVAALPVFSLFLIYANARSGRSLKRTGYSILRVLMLVLMAVCAILIPFCINFIFELFTDFAFFITWVQLPVALLLTFSAASALKSARQVAVNGFTCRRFSGLLPVMLIVSLCCKTARLILLLLANTVASLTETLWEYRVSTAPRFYCTIAALVLKLVATVLFLLLCFRGKAALSQPKGVPAEPTEAPILRREADETL